MESFLEYITSIDPALLYAGLFVGAYLENILPPVPGDTIVVFGAYLVGAGKSSLILAFISTTAGSFLGFMTYFMLGKFIGHRIVDYGRWRVISFDHYQKVERWFTQYGYWLIAANRFIAGARSVISFVAGATELKTYRVAVLALISCAVWNGILIYAGYTLGDNWEVAIEYIKQYNKIVIGALIVIAAAMIAKRYFKNKNSR